MRIINNLESWPTKLSDITKSQHYYYKSERSPLKIDSGLHSEMYDKLHNSHSRFHINSEAMNSVINTCENLNEKSPYIVKKLDKMLALEVKHSKVNENFPSLKFEALIY